MAISSRRETIIRRFLINVASTRNRRVVADLLRALPENVIFCLRDVGLSVRWACPKGEATLFIVYPGGSPNYRDPTIEFYRYQLDQKQCTAAGIDAYFRTMQQLPRISLERVEIIADQFDHSHIKTVLRAINALDACKPNGV